MAARKARRVHHPQVRHDRRPRTVEDVLQRRVEHLAAGGGGGHDDRGAITRLQHEETGDHQHDQTEHRRAADRRQVQEWSLSIHVPARSASTGRPDRATREGSSCRTPACPLGDLAREADEREQQHAQGEPHEQPGELMRSSRPNPSHRSVHQLPRRRAVLGILAIVCRDERDRPLVGERPLKQIGPGEAVHVAAERQPEEIQDRRRHVDDRRARLLAAARDRRAVRQEEPVRRRLVRAADSGSPITRSINRLPKPSGSMP